MAAQQPKFESAPSARGSTHRPSPSTSARTRVADKRSVDVEKLLVWAYRDELAKRHTSSAEGIWDRIDDMGWLGGIDPTRTTPQRYDFGLPDPDAEAIERAVGCLQDVIIDWAASAEAIMGDLAPILNTRHHLLARPFRTAALVTMHAKMDARPDWDEGEPRPYPVMAPRGRNRPHIVGECRGHNHYTAGSYCPLKWDPPATGIALARAEYAVWHRGLCTLAAELELTRFQALPPTAPQQPWCEAATPARIFAVGEHPRRTLPLRPERSRPFGPARSRRASPVRHVSLDKGERETKA